MNRLTLALVLAASLGASGCYLHTHGLALEERVAELEGAQIELSVALRAEGARLEATLESARTELAALEAALAEAQSTPLRAVANLGNRMDELDQRLRELNGLIEVLSHRHGDLQERIRAVDRALEDVASECCM